MQINEHDEDAPRRESRDCEGRAVAGAFTHSKKTPPKSAHERRKRGAPTFWGHTLLHYAETLQAILDQVQEGLRVEAVRDDSLIRRFRKHDLIIIDPTDTALRSGVAMVELNGRPTAVEIKPAGRGLVRLSKHDMLWRPVTMSEDEIASRIMGRIIGAVVSFKRARQA